jgi:hypothetical protein
MSVAAAAEAYLHWLQIRLGNALVDDLMTPDQAVAFHELCRGLRLGEAPLPDDVPEAALADAGLPIETCLEAHVLGDSAGLWLVGAAPTGACTLLHDLVLGLCAPARRPLPVPLLVCGNATRASIALLGLTGPWEGLSAAAALDLWWDAVELDIRRGLDRTWRAAPVRGLPALHVLGGVDELRGPAAQRTVLAWTRELAADGRAVVVASRHADVPELAELHARGALRRRFVLPLTRPPQDRFLAAWARMDGPWGRADEARLAAARGQRPGVAALARRPPYLAMLAVLSGRAAALPGDLPALQRALLGELDLGHPAHRQLLARVVADPASALDGPTRRGWLAALVAAAVAGDQVELGEALGRDERLAPAGADLLLAATRAWADGACPMGPVLEASPAGVARPPCDPHHDEEMARLLWLGRAAGWWGPEAIFVLRRAVPARARLVDECATELRPRPLLLALAALDAVWGASPAALLRTLPLGLLLAEGGTLGPVTAAALLGDGGCPELAALFRRYLELELALVALAVDDDELQATVMDLAAARDLDIGGALDLALAQEGAAPLRPRPRGERDEDRGAYLDLALALAARLTPCGAPALVADLERARSSALGYGDCFGGARTRRRLTQLVGFIITLLIYAVDHRLLQRPRRALRRAEVLACQQQLASPEQVAAAFPEDRRPQAAADWRWVTRQRWAPHRVAEALLARMPESLALGPAEVLPRCHAWLRAWLAEHDPPASPPA